MKKFTIVKAIFISFIGYLLITGYSEGPAHFGEYDCTGAETNGNPKGCFAVSGCHNPHTTPGIGITIELDSGVSNLPASTYLPNTNYTIKISGINNTSFHLPKFGFQLAATYQPIAEANPINEGTFYGPFPSHVRFTAPHSPFYLANIVEHDTALAATTGSGGNGTTYVERINWTSPSGWTGAITLWVALNAVNANGQADTGDHWNTAQLTIFQGPAGINTITEDNGVKVYPNPCNGKFTIQWPAASGQRSKVEIYNMLGQTVYSTPMSIVNYPLSIDLGNQPAGIYLYNIIDDNNNAVSGKMIVQ